MLTFTLPKNPVIERDEITHGLVCGKTFVGIPEAMMAVPSLLVVTDPDLFRINFEKAAMIAQLLKIAEVDEKILSGLGIKAIGARDTANIQEESAWREAVQGYDRLTIEASQNQGCERNR